METKPFFVMMVDIMRGAWGVLSVIKLDGVPLTSIIVVFLFICIVVGLFLGGRNSI